MHPWESPAHSPLSTTIPLGDIITYKSLYSPRKALVTLDRKPRFHLCAWLYPDCKTFSCSAQWALPSHTAHTPTHTAEGSISAGRGPSHPFWFKVCLFSPPESPINDPRLCEGTPPLSSLHFHFPHSSCLKLSWGHSSCRITLTTHTQACTCTQTHTHIAHIISHKKNVENNEIEQNSMRQNQL